MSKCFSFWGTSFPQNPSGFSLDPTGGLPSSVRRPYLRRLPSPSKNFSNPALFTLPTTMQVTEKVRQKLEYHYHITTIVLRLFGILSGTTRASRYQKGKSRKVKTNLDLLQQEIVSGSGVCWAICKSAPGPRQITTPASHHSVFYRPDALPATQPTASKHWSQNRASYL